MTGIHPWSAGAWRALLAKREKLPQALLIHGPRGIGKLELGRRFAGLILCETPGVDEPCGKCDGCRWFAAGQHPDYRQVEPEALAAPVEPAEDAPAASRTAKPSQEIKVDQVRELAGFLNIGSHRGRRRLALFHPAETMNANAANSLLKSLEDPASGACFILISHNHAGLLPTIRSRCVALPLAIPERNASLAWLEAAGVPDAADWLAFSGGAPLLAREYAASERGRLVRQLMGLVRSGGKDALAAWPANDREDIEALAEVLQKWACDQVMAGLVGRGNFFGPGGSNKPRNLEKSREWVRFAASAGQYRAMARHPLNPKLFALDLISMMPE